MDRYAAGDDSAFGELYDEIAPRLYGFLRRHCRDSSTPEEILQQTMLQIHRYRGTFVAGAEVLPWAIAIARRLLIDRARRESRRPPSNGEGDDGLELLTGGDRPDEVAEARRLAARLDERLRSLPEAQRVAFQLLKHDGLSVIEAAQVLGTTVTAVKLRAHRAYEALRAVLDDPAPPQPSTQR